MVNHLLSLVLDVVRTIRITITATRVLGAVSYLEGFSQGEVLSHLNVAACRGVTIAPLVEGIA